MGRSDPRLDIGHGLATRLGKFYLRAQQQRAEAEVGEGQHNVEILVHVAVVQDVVAVEAEEDAGPLQRALPSKLLPLSAALFSPVEEPFLVEDQTIDAPAKSLLPLTV